MGTKVMYVRAIYDEKEKLVKFKNLENMTVFQVSYQPGTAVPVTEYLNKEMVTNCWLFGTGKTLIRKVSLKDEHGRYFVRKLRVRNGDYFRATLITVGVGGSNIVTRLRQYNSGSINDQIELSCQEIGILHIYRREMLNLVELGPDDRLYENSEAGWSIVYSSNIKAFDLYIDKKYRKDLTELLALVNVTLPYKRYRKEWGYGAGEAWQAPSLYNDVEYDGKWRCF